MNMLRLKVNLCPHYENRNEKSVLDMFEAKGHGD